MRAVPWESVESEPSPAARAQLRIDRSAALGVGFMPLYESRQDAEDAWPGAPVVMVERPE